MVFFSLRFAIFHYSKVWTFNLPLVGVSAAESVKVGGALGSDKLFVVFVDWLMN